MQTTLVVLTVIVGAILVVLTVGTVVFVRRVSSAAEEVAVAAREVAESFSALREAVVPVAGDVKCVLTNLDGLVTSARARVDSIGRITRSVESLMEGRVITDAAGRAVAGSRSTVVAILEGLREGLRALRRPGTQREEEPTDG